MIYKVLDVSRHVINYSNEKESAKKIRNLKEEEKTWFMACNSQYICAFCVATVKAYVISQYISGVVITIPLFLFLFFWQKYVSF